MNKALVILLLFISNLGLSQNSKEWNQATGALLDSLKTHISQEHLDAFQYLIKKRSEGNTYERVDSLQEVIKITEAYDYISDSYGVFEIYRSPEGKISSFLNSKTNWGADSVGYEKFVESRIALEPLEYFPPRKYVGVLGCNPNFLTKRKAKKTNSQAQKEGEVSENYVKICTLINNRTGRISITFMIPEKGIRQVDLAYGPSFTEIQLEDWLK